MGKFLSIAAGLSFLAASSSFGTVWPSDGTGTGHNYLGGSVKWMHDNRAQNGDTITIPAGTFIWTTAVNITKAITLQGAGVGVTIVKDAGGLPHWTLAAGQFSRMTGIEFQDGGRVNAVEGIISVSGSNTNGSTFRWDHCKFNQI